MSNDDAVSDSFFDVSTLSGEGTDEDDLLVGTVLDGRYRLDRLLGEGGMGRVYAGTQLSVGREVAVKLLRGEALAQREVKDRFLREAQVISGFSHPNIVRLIDYGEDTERRLPYLVMELVRGVSLGELTRRGRLDLPLALEIVYQVCGALVQAHSAGIVHRDLKPDNLQLMPVVGDSFQAKVLDFGIAFPRESDARITSTGMICGTAYYIAPEQARALELDGRADLYALGVILYQMLSGHLPFRGDSDFQILLMQVQESPPALSDYLPPDEVPPEVIKLVHDLLAKDPDERPPSARAVRERIEVIRTRCAIAPLRLDLETASADAFERWILAPAEAAPIFEASTALDGSTPPEVREKLGERRRTMVEPSSAAESAGDDAEPRSAEAPELARVSPNSPELAASQLASSELAPSEPDPLNANQLDANQLNSNKPAPGKIVAALAVAIVAAAGIAAYLWQARQPPDPPPARAAADSSSGAKASPLEAPQKSDDAPTHRGGAASGIANHAALSSFAGRCMVIGESDTWFHTVFLYPDVGEVLLQGDERLLWSALDVVEQKGQRLEFTYRKSDGKLAEPTSVRASADRLIFKIEGDASSSVTSKFVCQKHADQIYFDTLGLSGGFTHTDDEEKEAHVPSSGQRLTLADTEYVYRILGGASLAEGYDVALRQAEDPKAPWKQAAVIFDEESGLLSIRLGNEVEQYRSKEALRRASRKAAEEAERRKAEAARRKEAARARAQAKEKRARTSSAASTSTDPESANALPAYLQPAPERVYEKYRKKVRASVDRYCAVMDERSAQVAHHQKLVDEKRYDEAKTYRDEVLNDTTGYSQKIQAASYGYSNAVQRAAQAGLSSPQIQKLTKIWQDGCE